MSSDISFRSTLKSEEINQSPVYIQKNIIISTTNTLSPGNSRPTPSTTKGKKPSPRARNNGASAAALVSPPLLPYIVRGSSHRTHPSQARLPRVQCQYFSGRRPPPIAVEARKSASAVARTLYYIYLYLGASRATASHVHPDALCGGDTWVRRERDVRRVNESVKKKSENFKLKTKRRTS